MTDRVELLTPVGRLVQGSLYTPNDTDALGNPLTIKTGAKAGQPTQSFYFAVAIAKGSEQHWSQTEWGAKIYSVGVAGFPNGHYQQPSFAWKIVDGDSQIPDSKGRKPCDREGYAGHWVLKFSSSFAPKIVNRDGSKEITQKDHTNLGDYVQVLANVAPNNSPQTPGIYLNHIYVAHSGYGERISVGPDPKSVGFGQAPLPPGASITPPTGITTTPAPLTTTPFTAPVNTPAVPPVVVTPHTAILNPPATPVIKTTAKANGATYQQLISAGWTHDQMLQHGMIEG